MHLQDFDVERIVERFRHALGERREQIDAEAHVARFDDHSAFGSVLDFCLVGGTQSGRSEDVHLAGFGSQRGKFERGTRSREVHDAIRLCQQ